MKVELFFNEEHRWFAHYSAGRSQKLMDNACSARVEEDQASSYIVAERESGTQWCCCARLAVGMCSSSHIDSSETNHIKNNGEPLFKSTGCVYRIEGRGRLRRVAWRNGNLCGKENENKKIN